MVTVVPMTVDEELDDTDDEGEEDGDDCGGYNHTETSASSTAFPTPNADSWGDVSGCRHSYGSHRSDDRASW
jgi:hypothetical protein